MPVWKMRRRVSSIGSLLQHELLIIGLSQLECLLIQQYVKVALLQRHSRIT